MTLFDGAKITTRKPKVCYAASDDNDDYEEDENDEVDEDEDDNDDIVE